MKIKKHIVSVIALVLVLLMVLSVFISAIASTAHAVSQSDIDKLKDQKNALKEEQEELQNTIDELANEQASVIEQKLALDEQNELARQEIELINEQIDIYDQLIEVKGMELEEAQAAEREQMARYRTRMRTMEEDGSVSYLSVLFQASSFTDLLSRIDFIREIMEYDSELEDECIEARERVETVKAEFEEIQVEQEQTRVELEDRKAELEGEIDAACKLIADLENDIEAYTAYYEEKEAMEAELDAEITEMLQELKRQEEAAAAAAAAAAANNNNNNGNGSSGGGNTISTNTGTGTYIWPLPGYSAGTRTFGNQFHPILQVWRSHNGQDIGAPSGTPIIAADSGTAYTYPNSTGGYGNYVLVNHGGGRATLYAHMSSIGVSNGESVSQGQVIGYVGSTGLSTGPHLHFETRVNGSAVDPMSYFGG